MTTRLDVRRRGMTLIEMLAFVALSTLLVVGVTGAIGQSRRLSGAAAQRAKLALLATEELDRLRALGPDALEESLGRREVAEGPVTFVLESTTKQHPSGMRALSVTASTIEVDPPAPLSMTTLVPETRP